MKNVTLIALAASLLALQPAQAFNPQPDPPGFGMIGVTPGETLRISAANPEVSNPTGVPPGPCRVELSFVDSAGNLLLPAVQFTLRAGQSAHYDLNGDKLGPPPGTVNLPAVQRTQVRPIVRVLPNPTAAAIIAVVPPGPCVSTIEMFDNVTGKTLVASRACPPGPPTKVFGQLGIVAGQTIRLNAVNVAAPGTSLIPPGPCRVTLVFFDENGNALAHSSQLLQPGAATFLDFSLPVVTVNGGGRAEVRADVVVENTTAVRLPPGPCRATLEVFDSDTGRTTAVLSPQRVRGFEPPPDPDANP